MQENKGLRHRTASLSHVVSSPYPVYKPTLFRSIFISHDEDLLFEVETMLTSLSGHTMGPLLSDLPQY